MDVNIFEWGHKPIRLESMELYYTYIHQSNVPNCSYMQCMYNLDTCIILWEKSSVPAFFVSCVIPLFHRLRETLTTHKAGFIHMLFKTSTVIPFQNRYLKEHFYVTIVTVLHPRHAALVASGSVFEQCVRSQHWCWLVLRPVCSLFNLGTFLHNPFLFLAVKSIHPTPC